VPNQDAFHRLNLHALRPKQAGARRRLGLLALRLAPFRPPRFGLPRRGRNRRVRLPPKVARLTARAARGEDALNRLLQSTSRHEHPLDRPILESPHASLSLWHAASTLVPKRGEAPRLGTANGPDANERDRVEPRFDDELPASARSPMGLPFDLRRTEVAKRRTDLMGSDQEPSVVRSSPRGVFGRRVELRASL